MHDKIILDPSCFTSLEKLRDTKHLLNEIRVNSPELKVYIPSIIHKIIFLPPEQKFLELPSIINEWIEKKDSDNIERLDESKKEDYVFVMREFLELHKPIMAEELVKDIKKIGRESLYLDNLIQKFGKLKGNILFEVMVISAEFKGIIISSSEKTFSLMKKIGTEIKRGISTSKQELKHRARMRTPLFIAMLFMEHYGIIDFVEDFQIEGIEIPIEVLPAAGLIALANG